MVKGRSFIIALYIQLRIVRMGGAMLYALSAG